MILSDLRQDLSYGVRSLKGAPGFFAVAVLTVGLGIGAATSVFSVVDALLLRPLPFHEPERFVQKSLGLAAIGVLVGTLGALGLSRLISSLLYGIGATDPLTYGLVILILTLTTAVAAYFPARRASQTDPARVLGSA